MGDDLLLCSCSSCGPVVVKTPSAVNTPPCPVSQQQTRIVIRKTRKDPRREKRKGSVGSYVRRWKTARCLCYCWSAWPGTATPPAPPPPPAPTQPLPYWTLQTPRTSARSCSSASATAAHSSPAVRTSTPSPSSCVATAYTTSSRYALTVNCLLSIKF